MKKSPFFLPLFLLLSMCASNDDGSVIYDCSAVSCEANFSTLYVEVFDKESGKNVFSEEIYTEADLGIIGSETVSATLENNFDRDLLAISDSLWKVGAFDYSVALGNDNSFAIALVFDSTGGEGCCSNRLFLKNLKIDRNSKNLQDFPRFFTVVLD